MTGFVAPIIAQQVNGSGQFLLGLIWVILAGGMHCLALAVLGGLKT